MWHELCKACDRFTQPEGESSICFLRHAHVHTDTRRIVTLLPVVHYIVWRTRLSNSMLLYIHWRISPPFLLGSILYATELIKSRRISLSPMHCLLPYLFSLPRSLSPHVCQLMHGVRTRATDKSRPRELGVTLAAVKRQHMWIVAIVISAFEFYSLRFQPKSLSSGAMKILVVHKNYSS